ncbi:tetratricopeptide repeat protein [Vibrio sp. ZSDZ65]|uniref:Tetratricopeptide repeat protein n=2 Tax=Vibrio qingdaonensis TaxID=2829491 RepID=A0A9X3CKX4_9VIBR|nr:tetratricopeptide repeat protein [Vibrio qingdaonensis]MCW8345342.1 tetratricopeptide repeat protein [Vibrio qingdaonensis]
MPLHAVNFTSPLLVEADKLVNIEPQKASDIASDYLDSRKFIEQTDDRPSNLSRDDTDQRVRTPLSSVNALTILAQAQFNLGHVKDALERLDEAEAMTKQYRLLFLELDIRILKTRLTWLKDGAGATALDALKSIESELEGIRKGQSIANRTSYRIKKLQGEIASAENEFELANHMYQKAGVYIPSDSISKLSIDYHTAYGTHFLRYRRYNEALSELLLAYWAAIELNSGDQLANINQLLAQLFMQRQVLDKALEHLSQAADFYDSYPDSPVLVDVLKLMGDIYFLQGKYNLALVHYFNVVDHRSFDRNIEKVIDIRISLASTYLQLYNYPLAEQYLTRAQSLLSLSDYPALKARAALLYAGLAYHQKDSDKVLLHANEALALSQSLKQTSIEQQSYQLLALGHEQKGNYKLALENIKHANSLRTYQQEQLNQISEDAFRQQKQFVEQGLHYETQKLELKDSLIAQQKFQKVAFGLFCTVAIVFLFGLRMFIVNRRIKRELLELNETLFTHARSGLPNLRLLNANLPSSLQRTQRNFEQWQVGELINEPLSDRLRFVMIDVPFLRNMYLQNGYKAGLELERAFGEFVRNKIDHPARIYHFSDANLLYIEPSIKPRTAESLFEEIQSWVSEFEPDRKINRIVRVGMANYPFLPRAYTAINDKELLDILLVSTHMARDISMQENKSHWVYLKAIDNAPAASLATDDIRKACKTAIKQGLIKVHSSSQNEDGFKKTLTEG